MAANNLDFLNSCYISVEYLTGYHLTLKNNMMEALFNNELIKR